MKNTDVLVIGGSAAGFGAALASKSHYPEKSVILVRKEKNAAIPCGIPYIFGTLEKTEQDILPDGGLIKAGVDILVNEVSSVDGEKKTCKLRDGEEISYDKLILATGSKPVVPGWLKGAQLENVFTVPKDLAYLEVMKKKLAGMKDIVVIGAGFIGIEMSDELKKTGKNVTLVELQPHVLPLAFDADLADEAETILKERGVNILTGKAVKEIIGKEKVEAVKIEYGDMVDIIKADAVILSVGYEPTTELANTLDVAFNRDG
ncbi:MAG: FAD-dependent oxidoreductase, partial [Bacteroides sp.]|nr:FAD-dependent oxidoreductase [Bacteroides sp.]